MEPQCTGDHLAARFKDLIRDHYGTVVAYLARRTASVEDAEDLAVATFGAAWRRLAEAPSEPRTRAWLLSIARGHLSNHWRGDRRRRRLLGRLVSVGPAPAPDPEGIAIAAFQRLRPGEQEVLRLSVWDDLTPAEAAEVLGCSVNAYHIRLHRARRALRAHYQRLRATFPLDVPGPGTGGRS